MNQGYIKRRLRKYSCERKVKMKKIVTLFMLLAALAIHAADPIIMTNTSLDLKLSLYPVESSEEGSIVFWTNKGEVERWSVTTASGKNYEMAVKSRYVVEQDGITKYMVKSSLDKDTFIKVFKNDLPVSVSFQIKGFANGQYATIDLPQDIKNHFASELENFNRPKQQPSTPADVIKFMGIPLWGDIETFAKQLESKGWKFERKTPMRKEDYGIYPETWYFEGGKFWEFSNCDLIVKVLINSRLVYSATVTTQFGFVPAIHEREILKSFSKKYGEFKQKDFDWVRQVGQNKITIKKGTRTLYTVEYPNLSVIYENRLAQENAKIEKQFHNDFQRKQESQRRRANQDL